MVILPPTKIPLRYTIPEVKLKRPQPALFRQMIRFKWHTYLNPEAPCDPEAQVKRYKAQTHEIVIPLVLKRSEVNHILMQLAKLLEDRVVPESEPEEVKLPPKIKYQMVHVGFMAGSWPPPRSLRIRNHIIGWEDEFALR